MPARKATGTPGVHGAPDSAILPDTYRHHSTVDLKKNRGLSGAVQVFFLLAAASAVGGALLLDLPLQTNWNPMVSVPVMLVACVVYMAIHEATHGVALQLLTRVAPSYTVRFPFLSTGNHAYLTRRTATIVALAPLVLWGIVLIAAVVTVPDDFRLSVYVLLALNVAGSAGDLVEVWVVARQRPDALLQDDGDEIHVFHPLASPAPAAAAES